MNCIFCRSPQTRKIGRNTNHIQRYFCQVCHRCFLESYHNAAYSRRNLHRDIQVLWEKGFSKRRIAKILKISPTTVQKYAPQTQSSIKTQLQLGDCHQLIQTIPAQSVDLILTDPPYNIATANQVTKRGNRILSNKDAWGQAFKDHWTSIDEYYTEFLAPILRETCRVLKPAASVILFLGRQYTGYLIYRIKQEFHWIYRNKLYFEKVNPVPSIRKRNYRSTIDEAVWFTVGPKFTFNFLGQSEMKQLFKGSIGTKQSNHPTEKYAWMIDPVIERHTHRFDTILDLFSGSGAISCSAMRLQRNIIAFELNGDYYKESLVHYFLEK